MNAIDWTEIVARWSESGRTPATIRHYLYWARQYVAICQQRGGNLTDYLTEERAKRYYAAHVKAGDTSPPAAVRALACALAAMGCELPPWGSPAPERQLSPLVRAFVAYRLSHRGVAAASARFDGEVASAFLRWLCRRGHKVAHVHLADVDAFVEDLGRRWAPISVAGACSTLRAFLAFLFATGRCCRDLAGLVISPRIRPRSRPPRALQWVDVKRILRAIDARQGLGPRDFAIFLMMATYGMGAGEITRLTLDDIDWTARTVRIRRPKTGVITQLPLLDPVARALARYLRYHRPVHARDRAVFVSHRMPHARLSGCGPLRDRLVMYADRAGVRAEFLGTHVFRHTHATRQIEGGVSAKLVGDVLGHRRPESTSAYVRSALPRLRSVGLPVPR